MASRVSLTEPIWLSLMSAELATFFSMPSAMMAGLVTNRSSPTSWAFSPSCAVMAAQPSQSCSARPSSIDHTGYFAIIAAYRSIMSAVLSASPATW